MWSVLLRQPFVLKFPVGGCFSSKTLTASFLFLTVSGNCLGNMIEGDSSSWFFLFLTGISDIFSPLSPHY